MRSEVPEVPLFDPVAIERLRKVAGDQGQSFVAEMAQLFLSETSKQLQDLRKGCDEGDWRRVSRLAHSVKSSSATLGLMRLSEACRDLEMDTQDTESTPATLGLSGAVFDQFERVIPILKGLG